MALNFNSLKSSPIDFLKHLLAPVVIFPAGILLGWIIGVRSVEVGSGPSSYLKGGTVYITGVCKIGENDRLPALSNDQVTVTQITEKTLKGVIRKTRESVDCDRSIVAISPLPLLSQFANMPSAPTEISCYVPPKKDTPPNLGLEFINKTFKVSGVCVNLSTNNGEAFVDQVVAFTKAEQKETASGPSLSLSGIVKSEGKFKGVPVLCSKESITYEPAVLTQEGVQENILPQTEESLIGKQLVVTSTCFPDPLFKKKGSEDQLFYPIINALVQVTKYKKLNGKITYLAGALIDKGAMIECDDSRYPISWTMFDPSRHRLNPIKPKEQ